jgi:hypothetical protein
MNDTALVVSFVVLFGGMMTMVISAAIAKKWLANNTGYQASRVAAFFFGPLLTSFGPMRLYAEERRARNLPTTLATVFWSATAVWGIGIISLIGVLSSLGH